MATQFVLTGDIPLRNLENYFDPEGVSHIHAEVEAFKHLVKTKIQEAEGKTFYIRTLHFTIDQITVRH